MVCNIVLVAVVMWYGARLIEASRAANERQNQALLDTMQIIVSTVMNPYGETVTTQPNAEIQQRDTATADEMPDLDYDPTDALIPRMPDPLPHMMVPPGWSPIPGDDNSEEARQARMMNVTKAE